MKRFEKVPPDAFVAAAPMFPYHPFYASLTKKLGNCKRDKIEKQLKPPRQNLCCASKMQNLQCNSRTHAHSLLMIPLSGPRLMRTSWSNRKSFGVLWFIAGVSRWPVDWRERKGKHIRVPRSAAHVSLLVCFFLIFLETGMGWNMMKPEEEGKEREGKKDTSLAVRVSTRSSFGKRLMIRSQETVHYIIHHFTSRNIIIHHYTWLNIIKHHQT